MTNQIKKVKKQLTALLWTCILIAVAIMAMFESNVVLPGGMAGDINAEFVTASVIELVTLAVIPIAMWLFKWKKVKSQLKECPHRALLKWGSLRLMLLCLPLIASVVAFYLFQKPAFGYLALVLALCLFFVYPSKQKCLQETNIDTE